MQRFWKRQNSNFEFFSNQAKARYLVQKKITLYISSWPIVWPIKLANLIPSKKQYVQVI
jgi:hypothetical protein